jgi:hypothetical protein
MLITGSDHYNRTERSCQHGPVAARSLKLMEPGNSAKGAVIRKWLHANAVTAAVRELREVLGESQQQFALRMQTAIRTIARYETVRPPKGKVLRQLEELALESRQLELARIFRIALTEEMGGIPLFDASKPYSSDVGLPRDLDIATLTWMKQHPNKYGKELRLWERISKAAKQDLLDRRKEMAAARKMIDAVVKLLKQGKTKEEIEDLLRVKIKADAMDMLAVGLNPASPRSLEVLAGWLRRLPNLFIEK